jgi:taurine dioxygenase
MNTAVADTGVKLYVRPLSPILGAEVRGVDLSCPLDEPTRRALYRVFLEHHLLSFPDQEISDDAHIAFARAWGKPQVHVLNQYLHNRHPEIFMLTNLTADGNRMTEHPDPGAAIWHTDGSWSRERGLATILYSLVVPKSGGDTLFCNMHRAYDMLPDELKQQLEGRRAIHDLNFSRQRTSAKTQMTEEQRRKAPPVDHEIVRTHPDTGRKALYLGEHAASIDGMPFEDGRAMIEMLNALATQPDNVYTHRWRVRELVIWDNRSVMHKATGFDFANDSRLLRRITTTGEKLPPAAQE